MVDFIDKAKYDVQDVIPTMTPYIPQDVTSTSSIPTATMELILSTEEPEPIDDLMKDIEDSINNGYTVAVIQPKSVEEANEKRDQVSGNRNLS